MSGDVVASAGVVEIYDTTLRDGSQIEGMSLTVDDKLKIAEQLDQLGVHYIEGGWPGANPKDVEFFARASRELKLKNSTLVAFGMTRRAGGVAESDPVLLDLLSANTNAICIVAKTWDFHVREALRTTEQEAVAMAADSVRFLKAEGREVLLDAEHFFDGYLANPEFSMTVLRAAHQAGADVMVLCDTNGGMLPHQVEEIVAQVKSELDCRVAVHLHNDSGCAVASSIAGVRAGATQVQGCINGYGERAGNVDLVQVIPNLSLKLGYQTVPSERLQMLTPVAHHIAELVNIAPNPQQPYAGPLSFTHKAGLHSSALARNKAAYEHIDPGLVGNGTRVVVSELGGLSSLRLKAQEFDIELDDAALSLALDTLKRLEHEGYHFEVADGSLELLMRRSGGWKQPFFEVEGFRVITDDQTNNGQGSVRTEATIKVEIDGERIIRTAEGNGPVNAIDQALRAAIAHRYPALNQVHLTDYKVRVLDTDHGTEAVTRVLIDSMNEHRSWTTIGVSPNIIEASWQALEDSIVYALLHSS